MQQATLCFLIRGQGDSQEILLGRKKIGFGLGKIAGFGGKVEPGERVEAAARREMAEETGVKITPQNLVPRGSLEFKFPYRPDWGQHVFVFVAYEWDGLPQESAEMAPAWYPVGAIPFDQMWQDAAYWLPPVIQGQTVALRFIFSADNESVQEFYSTINIRS